MEQRAFLFVAALLLASCLRGGFGENRSADMTPSDAELDRTDADSGLVDSSQDAPEDDAPAVDLGPDAPHSCGVLVYISSAKHAADLGGRAGADAFCASNRPSGLSCSNVHALLSVDVADTIQSMPLNFGYDAKQPLCWFSPAKLTKFADSWSDMLDGSIQVSLRDGTGIDAYVWTGSTNSGELHQTSPDSKCQAMGTPICRYTCLNWSIASYGGASGSHWSFSYWFTANVSSAPVAMPDVTTDWLSTTSPFSKKRQYGPVSCCGYEAFACPTACPDDAYEALDLLSCGASANLMCACVP